MVRSTLVYHPRLAFGGRTHQVRGKMKGRGYGTVLLDGGMGGQSSYSSIDDYISTTARPSPSLTNMGGMGLVKNMTSPFKKEAMNDKIKSMMVKPKVKNIKFNL